MRSAPRAAPTSAAPPWAKPMCRAPHVFEEFTAEKPGGYGSGYGTVTWTAEATPIVLNTFAHLVRGALLKWWESMLSASTETPPQLSNPST